MPSANVSTATTVNPGLFLRDRSPYRRSLTRVSMCIPFESSARYSDAWVTHICTATELACKPTFGRCLNLSLRGRAENNFVHVDVGRLLDREGDGAGDGIRWHGEFVTRLKE